MQVDLHRMAGAARMVAVVLRQMVVDRAVAGRAAISRCKQHLYDEKSLRKIGGIFVLAEGL